MCACNICSVFDPQKEHLAVSVHVTTNAMVQIVL